MTRLKDRHKALELRKQGKSYSQIKQELSLSKSTLSAWLRKYPLSREQIRQLRDISATRIEKFRQTMQRKRQTRFKQCYQEEKEKWLPLSQREFFLAGLFLYWGEGAKGFNSVVSLNNTDPKVIKFFCRWMIEGLGIPKQRIKIILHIYQDMDLEKITNYWSRLLDFPKEQFIKPFVKNSKKIDIDQKGFGQGTCTLYFYNARLKERILLGIEAIADKFMK